MASSSSSSAQARSIVSPKLYDAFISHRGPDVKDTLVKQLYDLLKARKCEAFLDREEIEGGDSITLAIENGILSSRVQIAIFSKGYAESKWCLDELVLMLQQTDALFIPVFYGVEPKELRSTERGSYVAAFTYYQSKEKYLNKVRAWKEALASAADISGYELSQHQGNLCEKIVSRVVQVIQEKRKSTLHVAKYPVGLDELVQNFERCCSKRAGMVGIFGLGGSGKTTLSKELFNKKSSAYHKTCFLSDVRESHARGDLHCLQKQLLKDLVGRKEKIRSVHHGIGMLKKNLGRAKHLHFLIVLDDIDHEDQLDDLLPEGMLGSGSMVIITTRNKSVLRGADIRYQMKGMDWYHAKDLFCSHAFRGEDPPTKYEKLVESFVKFCGGLPLSLIVLGAHVYRRDEYYWELELEKVKKIQPEEIKQRLKISFDGLDREERQIFIDIACLFNKKRGYGFYGENNLKSKAITIWKASGWSAEHALQTLQDKCLVEVVTGGRETWFEMHDHLRDLGRQMADELGPPRLWRSELLRSMEAKGFKEILEKTKDRCFHSLRDSSLGWTITYFIAETGLMWLEILGHGSNSISIPSWIPLQNLHILCIWKAGKLELWNNFQQQLQTNTQASFEMRKLQIMDTRFFQEQIIDSLFIQKLPDLIEMFSHLEELYINKLLGKTDTASLVQSIKQLRKLRSLKLLYTVGGCSGNFDLSKGRDSINSDSSTSGNMDSLETIELLCLQNISKLVISGEMCPKLRSLEVRSMYNLKEMELNQLERLNTLTVENCDNLETISGLSTLIGLQMFRLAWCEELKWLPTLAHLRRLEEISIKGCSKLQSVEGAEELPGLRSLEIEIPDFGCAYPWVRNYIYGLRILPVNKIVQIISEQKAMGKVSSKLNADLFSEVIGAQEVSEIERGEYELLFSDLKMSSSSSAITIYVLLVTPMYYKGAYLTFQSEDGYDYKIDAERGLITVVLTQHEIEGRLSNVRIEKGFKVTVKVGEERKALTVLRRIADFTGNMMW